MDNSIGSLMRSVFSTPDGAAVLAWILTRCGMGTTNPALVSPDLIAFGNSILKEMEVGEHGHMGLYIRGLLGSYDAGKDE